MLRISKKLKSDYLFQKNIILNKKIRDRISQVDTLVFDIDGVLIDVQDSFKKAVCQTVQFYFKEILHFQGSQNLINPEEIEYCVMCCGNTMHHAHSHQIIIKKGRFSFPRE